MSTIVYVGDVIPEKNLLKVRKYKAYLSPDQKAEILDELSKNVPNINDDEHSITMHVEIEVKIYDKRTNDTKDT